MLSDLLKIGKIYLILIFLCASLTSAQEKDIITFITMEEAINRALTENNLVKASQYSVKKANWDVKRAWTQLFPTLSFNTRYTWIDKQTFAERDFRQYLPPELAGQIPQTVFQESYFSSFDVDMPLFNGVLVNGLSIAYEQETMAGKLSESTNQQVAYTVVSNYLNVLKSKEVVNLQKEYLELSKLNYEKAERLFKANRYSQNEALRWKVDYQQQKSTVVTSESGLRSALLNLARLTNTNLTLKTELEIKIPEAILLEVERIEGLDDREVLKFAEFTDEELVQINAALAASKSNEEIQHLLHRNTYSNYMPNVSLSYSHGWRENNTIELDDYSPKTLMVNLRLPIFTSFQNYTELKSTYYEYKKSEEEFKDQLLNTKLLLNDVVNRLLNLKTQQTLSASNVEFNENNYRIVETQRERGIVSNIDFIDAKLNLQNAKLQMITDYYDFITTTIEYYYLTGKIENLIK
jgi:outer membrane protein